MTEEERILNLDIASCNMCHGLGKGHRPLCFEMHGQRVMLITAMPSIQGIHKPLTSVRFFRRMCIALFGDRYLDDPNLAARYLLEFCDGEIYWTHYRKCSHREYHDDLWKIDSDCAGRFLKREIEILKPKLIIVMGDQIKDKVEAIIGRKRANVRFDPFPHNGFESEYRELRDKLRPYLKYVRDTGVTERSGDAELSNDWLGQEIHLRFELEAFTRMYNNRLSNSSEGSIEARWHESLVVPNMTRWLRLVTVQSFCENQIRVFLNDYLFNTSDLEILRGLRRAKDSTMPLWYDITKHLEKNWLEAFECYAVKRASRINPSVATRAVRVCRDLRAVQELRNAIVHNGGLMDRLKALKRKHRLPGIFVPGGTVYISPEGEKAVKALPKDVTDLLADIIRPSSGSSRIVADR